jgi:hypothetical protein
MTTFRHDVRFFSGQSEAKAERFETDWTFVLVLVVLGGDDWHGSGSGVRVGMGLGRVLLMVVGV